MRDDSFRRMLAKNKSKLKHLLFYLLILIPLFYIFYLVYLYGIDVPYWDQWALVPLIEKAYAGELSFSDLWVQHNEHRILFPRILMLLLAYITDWNIMYEIYLNVILAGMFYGTLYSLLRITLGSGISLWLPVIMSFLVFSPVQYENWARGWQMGIFLSVMCVAIAILSVCKWHGQLKGLLVAIAFSFIASFSFNNGLLIWIVVGVLLFFQEEKRKSHIALWGAATVITFFLYYNGYAKPPNHPSLLFPLKHPFDYTRFILAFIGGPLGFHRSNVSVIIGLLLTMIIIFGTKYLRRSDMKEFNRLLPLYALGLYAFLSAAVIGIGRAGFGVAYALESRYTTFSTPFIIVVMTVSFVWINNHRKLNNGLPRRWIVIVSSITTLLILSYVLTFTHGIEEFKHRKTEIEDAKGCLENVDSANDECLKRLHPYPSIVREGTKILLGMGLLKHQ